jgi:hypothetical protein
MHRTLLLAAPVLAALLVQLAPYYPLLAGSRRRTVRSLTKLGVAEMLTARALGAVPLRALELMPAALQEQHKRLRQLVAPGSSWEARMAYLQAARQLLEQVAEQLEAKAA